ncbi:hypothetical protein [Chromohalobacter canadensis]|uniref:hypothetical protein n=1 Tax=Chromohalobacter canadensis TaxID=141389 RepID=UPI0024105D7D|nr:hypothetical protein [Chromohalobacter canadensis]
MAARFDWEAIKADYRTGRYSLQQLSDMHGPNKASISKRATRDGWEKDLSQAVRQRTREKVSRSHIDTSAREALDKSDDEIVEEAATLNAAVSQGHRKHLERWRNLEGKYADLLTEQLERGTMTVQLKNGDLAEIDVPLDYIGKAMSNGTTALEKIVKLERQSYGMDEEGDDEPPERSLTDEEIDAKIADLKKKVGGE